MDAKRLTKSILIGLATGAAAAYFIHPKYGKKRRVTLACGTRKLLEKAAHEGKKCLSDSQHRLAGFAAKLGTNLKHEPPSDPVIEARIRSRMGRVVAHPRGIHVVCDRGVATLWGLILEEELPRLIAAVEKVSGVTEVVDHLEVVNPDELPTGRHDALREARDKIRLHWSPSKRLLLGTAGTALAFHGWRRKDKMGNLLALVGASMMARSTMQNHLRTTLALSTESPGFELEKTIRINAPISDLFDFWANPENYPKAFSHVERVERLGENLYRWTITGPAGVPIGWEGVITRIVPNTLVEWKSLPGSAIGNFGIVHFDPNYDASTRINIRMFYRPPAGILGRFFAELLGADASQILHEDLKRLKCLFENRAFVGEPRKARSEEGELLKMATT